jgi:hypothetical protein
MIGIVANPSDHAVVCEFFELFKTPWEFYQQGREYDVVLCDESIEIDDQTARVILIYAGHVLRGDAPINTACGENNKRSLLYKGLRIPLYGPSVIFQEKQQSFLIDAESKEAAAYLDQSNGRVLVRIGYDLFFEIRTLLSVGQPAWNASVPALDLHIAVLRDMIVANGVQLMEIPPVPEAYRFIACLTHDVDHPSIRRHKFDHTMWGFLHRAILRSLIKTLKGRSSWKQLLTNWAAAAKLPFVYLGLAKDFWLEFDQYPKLEGGRSSFFVIPFKGDPGRKEQGLAPKHRASGYCAADIAGTIQKLIAVGCEIGLHGIDAWHDSAKARKEIEEVRQITGAREIGVRMHWLYFNDESPVVLEKGGADYDSSFGYNNTVGYRAGTTQVYKPLDTLRLLELPLHIMDTALFFPSYLALSPEEARLRVATIIDHAVEFGGCVTVNWHDRSIAPERCWGDFYLDLVADLKKRGAWCATASETVGWFRKRRTAAFDSSGAETVRFDTSAPVGRDLPGLRLRVHRASGAAPPTAKVTESPKEILA